MSLLLAIESSSNVYRVVIGRDGSPVFDSAVNNCDSALRTLGELLSCGLEALNAEASEIKGIAINVGPGSLTFVRAGISFVNALAKRSTPRTCQWSAQYRHLTITRTLA
jgi:tRNA threonylcarbamoyladenosine biosynthesis protein TsaB